MLTAQTIAADSNLPPRNACWLAQQAVEKALKAVLVYLGIEFPWRHDLDALRNLIPDGWQLKEEHPRLGNLTAWAIAARYPGGWPDATGTDAQAAVQQARAVYSSVLRDLAERVFATGDRP